MENPQLNKDHINFTVGLAKGRVIQTIFEQMFRETLGYIVIPYGYEYTHPMMVHNFQYPRNIPKPNERTRLQPDYKVHPRKRSQKSTYVEVKYRHDYSDSDICADAKNIAIHWPTTHLFLATAEDFFMDPVERLIANDGSPTPFVESNFVRNVDLRKIREYHDMLRIILK